jgi:MoxR-like ATPase
MFKSIEELQKAMEKHKYITERSLATVVYLSLKMEKPILLEGEAGVGKTEIGKVLADILNTKLIRLQCYEGIDASMAIYEWNYPKQILRIRLEDVKDGTSKKNLEDSIFSEEYLIKRPLLEAIQSESDVPSVLLIDEIDRSDEEFEAFLLEILSDFQITVPEIGTIKAKNKPYVVLTSNRTREIHDALKRRCLYHWIDYPTFEKEYDIIMTKVPEVNDVLARQICGFMQKVREIDFFKKPGIAETLDWASALILLDKNELDEETVNETLGCIFKYNEDINKFKAEVGGKKVDIDKILKEWIMFHG